MDTGDENSGILSADTVYALMNHKYHVSRNERIQWYFRHLNRRIFLPPDNELLKPDAEIEILSIYPHDPPSEWNPSTRHNYQYLITQSTNVVYLSKVNKAVYCIDMSPSVANIDIPHGKVLLDEISGALKNSVEGVVRPIVIPGTSFTFEPNLFVTVIVHTPFFTTPAQQVLVQGWKVTSENVDEFLCAIFKQLEILENAIAKVSVVLHDEIDQDLRLQAESEKLVGVLFDENPEKQIESGISMVSPDSGFVNLLRYGMLALRLLPQSSLSNLIVITDGMINLPDIQVLESVLSQLRSYAVAVSFLQLGSQFHVDSSHGLVPYSELLQLIACATGGAYIPSPKRLEPNGGHNVYQEAFITWSLKKSSILHERCVTNRHSDAWYNFYGYGEPHLLTKKHCEEHLSGSLFNVICTRLHEGYLIKAVNLRDANLEIVMVLPWSYHIYIEYIIRTDFPEKKGTKNIIFYVVFIKAPYPFLCDITSPAKKKFSPYRQAVISRFWSTLKTLTHTDKFLSHLDSFSENSVAFTIPEGIKNGVPVFYLPSNSSLPELSTSGSSCSQIAQFWRPIVMLEPNVWPKWFHTHRLGLILQPDQSLPHVLQSVCSNSRVHPIQCRQAEAALYSCLKKLTTFTLIENHSYVKILLRNENDVSTPRWFYIVRVISKPPCSVIHIAFLGGTPGRIRHQVVETIREEICKLKIPQRTEAMVKRHDVDIHLRSEVECCTIINKPLEKILIRYERMPCEFSTVVFPDGTQPVNAPKPLKPTSTLITTLSRYLHHKRSIWEAHTPSASHNNLLPTMLTTLTRMRLREGFRFSHCTAGIINMVLEVQMKCYDEEDPDKECTGRFQPCVIQYVLFPPHVTTTHMKSSVSEEDTGDEAECELKTELITECWIEPQHGIVTSSSSSNKQYIESLHYHQIADHIWRLDAECISNLLTFDHLQLMCHSQEAPPPEALDPLSLHNNPLENWPHAVPIEDERIHRVPYAYNLMNLLPKCQQAEILNDMFVQVLSNDWNSRTRNDAPNNLLMENMLTHLQELHHRELQLSEDESVQLLELILNRDRNTSQHPIPFATGCNEDMKTTQDSSSAEQLPKNHKPPVAKWRCFVKSMASSHCVLTFVPASFHDLKMLMLSSENKIFKIFESQCSDGKDSKVFSGMCVSENDSSMSMKNNVFVNSKNSSRLDLESHLSEEDGLFDHAFHNCDRFEQPFRNRSSSWDPVKKQNEALRMDLKRVRTSSVGAKMKPASLIKTVMEHNLDESRPPEDDTKSVFGSITLPIYVYDCPLANVVDCLIFKSGADRKPDLFYDEKMEEHGNAVEDEALSSDELEVKYHCRLITKAFNKCFVLALFKSLHLNHRVNSHDVSIAVQECNETLLEIDITRYLQTVCGHYTSANNNPSGNDADPQFSNPCLPLEMSPLQKLIKKRFLEILKVCFRPISSNPDFFFCSPPPQLSRMADTGYDLTSQRLNDVDFDAYTLQSDVIDCSSHRTSIVGTWERGGVDSTMDDARTSLLSNMDSDSVSDNLTDTGEDLSPLFLHLVCSVYTSERGLWIANPVKVLPTCFSEPFANIRDLTDVNLSNLKITLGLHCLTLPPSLPVDVPQTDCPFFDASQTKQSVSDSGKGADSLQQLPEHQHKAVLRCIAEIEWFLQDEITLFLLDSQPITLSTLDFVVKHISSSGGRYTCTINTVNLDFVYGAEHSLDKFVDAFSKMKIQGYQLHKTGDYYYLIKNCDIPANVGRYRLCYPGGYSVNNQSVTADEEESTSRCLLTDLKHDISESLNKAYYACKYKWIKDLAGYRTTMPNFWLIMKINEFKVTVYFHCKFLEVPTEEVQHYKDVHMSVLDNIESVCKTVNQTLLLQSLHETRMCESVLEPEEPEDVWMNAYDPDPINVDIDMREDFSALMNKFHPGYFSCRVVWRAHFVLHPRLKTGPGKNGLSRAIQALRTVLNRFSVNNRKNMFVYQDSSGSSVFYLRLHENVRSLNRSGNIDEENSPSSVSRSSSVNSLTNKRSQDDSFSVPKEIRPRLKSLGENVEYSSHQEDVLTLKVHGISDAGGEVTHELVQVLQNRLNDAVLEVVSVMLSRNPMCKLTPDDVHFIQKPHLQAAHIMQFTIPPAARNSLDALAFYLRLNLQQYFFLPKYTDTRHTFQDFSQPEGSSSRINDSNIYLYNQSPVSGNKGIACIAVAIVDDKGNIISNRDVCKSTITCEAQPLDPTAFQDIQIVEVDVENYGSESETVMEVRLWKQGRVNMELLVQRLKNMLQYSLWDLITEYNILNTPIKQKINEGGQEIIEMNSKFYDVIPGWLQNGYELSVPAVKTFSIELSNRHAVGIILREMKHIISLHELTTHVFVEKEDRTGAHQVHSTDLDSACTLKCFIISSSSSHIMPESGYWKVTESPPKNGPLQYLPRQRFLIAIITNQKVNIHMYNWSKDRADDLMKLTSQLGVWLSSRSSFLIGVFSQKMGLFHNQPLSRKTALIGDIDNLENLLSFTMSATPRKALLKPRAATSHILRDSAPITRTGRRNYASDPVAASVEQIVGIKAANKKEQQDKLQVMWQSRGITPYIPLSDETLDIFLQHSRLFHYCLTPFLFHPRWRYRAAATRDHRLLNVNNPVEPLNEDLSWHQSVCSHFVDDYKQYLQMLGYTPVQTAPTTPRRLKKPEKMAKMEKDTKTYMQKSLIGGIIMLELSFSEPFFQIKCHGIECTRLQPKQLTNLIQQVILTFLDECSKIRIALHLHSFTYDYHLKSLEGYVIGQSSNLPRDYHLTSFLDDFLQYYEKAPNSASSLLYMNNLVSPNLSTSPAQLYDFLLSHEKDYEMDVLRMVPYYDNGPKSNIYKTMQENEFVMVKHRADIFKNTSIKNLQEPFNHFNITHIIACDKSSVNNKIKLNYYVILTCSRHFPPIDDVELRQGKFFTVTTGNRLNLAVAAGETSPEFSAFHVDSEPIEMRSPISDGFLACCALFSEN